ncbi:hypothetical protein JCM8547_006055 [Rhodosporidiobolus lusitaniae]
MGDWQSSYRFLLQRGRPAPPVVSSPLHPQFVPSFPTPLSAAYDPPDGLRWTSSAAPQDRLSPERFSSPASPAVELLEAMREAVLLARAADWSRCDVFRALYTEWSDSLGSGRPKQGELDEEALFIWELSKAEGGLSALLRRRTRQVDKRVEQYVPRSTSSLPPYLHSTPKLSTPSATPATRQSRGKLRLASGSIRHAINQFTVERTFRTFSNEAEQLAESAWLKMKKGERSWAGLEEFSFPALASQLRVDDPTAWRILEALGRGINTVQDAFGILCVAEGIPRASQTVLNRLQNTTSFRTARDHLAEIARSTASLVHDTTVKLVYDNVNRFLRPFAGNLRAGNEGGILNGVAGY